MQVLWYITNHPMKNITYFITVDERTYCIDPFNGEEVISFAKEQGLNISAIVNTHEHWDHISGNEALSKELGSEVINYSSLAKKLSGVDKILCDGEKFYLGDQERFFLKGVHTPGHTEGHMSLELYEEGKTAPLAVFSGDTLFYNGVGNCKNGGDVNILFETIKSYYCALDNDVLIYPGHDYMGKNTSFAQFVWGEQLEKVGENAFSPRTIREEKQTNPFLNTESERLRKHVQIRFGNKSKNIRCEKDLFRFLRGLRDDF